MNFTFELVTITNAYETVEDEVLPCFIESNFRCERERFSKRNILKSWVVFSALVLFFPAVMQLYAAETGQRTVAQRIQEIDTKNGGLLGEDVIDFVGPMTELQRSRYVVPENTVLLPLSRRSASNRADGSVYYILIKNVPTLEKQLLADAVDGRWDHFTLSSSALIAENVVDEQKIAADEARIEAVVRAVREEIQTRYSQKAVPVEELARMVFERMNKEILTGKYDTHGTSLQTVFETGNYNCVSATILFNTLMERFQVSAYGLEMPGHTLSRIRWENLVLDTETTCPTWFTLRDESLRRVATQQRIAREYNAPQTLPRSRNAAGEREIPVSVVRHSTTGLVAQPQNGVRGLAEVETDVLADHAALVRDAREISSVQLVAMIYYNQGVDRIEESRFAEAIILNAKALALDPKNDSVWKHVLTAINNWAIEYAAERRFSLAMRLLDQGRLIDPDYENFVVNQRYVFYTWIQLLADQGRFADAEKVYKIAQVRIPNDPQLQELMQSKVRANALSLN